MTKPQPASSERVRTPIGWIRVTRDPKGRIGAEFEAILPRSAAKAGPAGPADGELKRVASAIAAAIRGDEEELKRIPTPAGSPFHRKCWEAARRIPRGETRTYAWLAAAAGSPLAIRAAGQAMRRNPLPIIVPCHRVVAASGIGGFAGSAAPACERVSLKERLLALEGGSGAAPLSSPPPARNSRTRGPRTAPRTRS